MDSGGYMMKWRRVNPNPCPSERLSTRVLGVGGTNSNGAGAGACVAKGG